MQVLPSGWNVPASRLSQICLRLTGVPTANYIMIAIRIVLMLITTIQSLISLRIFWHDKNQVFRIANDVNTVLYGTNMVITLAIYSKRISGLFSMLQQGLFQYSWPPCAEQENAKSEAMKKIIKIERILNTTSVLGTILFFVCPILFGIFNILSDSKEKLLLPLSPWFPFTIDSIYLYVPIYLFELTICVTVVIYHISWQSSLYSSICCIQGEMRILSIAFKKIEETALEIREKIRTASPGKAPPLRCIDYYKEKCLRECIQHHQNIIKCVSTMNEGFKILIFEYLQCATFIFCLNVMRLNLEPLTALATMVTSVGEITPVLLQLWLVCSYGQMLSDEDESVRETFYDCQWPDQTKRFKQMLYIMLIRCKRTLRLSGGLYSVDMKTFSQILQAAYSYLNFLLSIHDHN